MPASDPITAVANAVEVLVDDIAKPLIDSAQAQAHDTQFRETCQTISDVLNLPDCSDRAVRLGALASRLCIDSGYPVAGLGEDVSVPVAFLSSLLAIAAQNIRDQQNLADLLHALNTK